MLFMDWDTRDTPFDGVSLSTISSWLFSSSMLICLLLLDPRKCLFKHWRSVLITSTSQSSEAIRRKRVKEQGIELHRKIISLIVYKHLVSIILMYIMSSLHQFVRAPRLNLFRPAGDLRIYNLWRHFGAEPLLSYLVQTDPSGLVLVVCCLCSVAALAHHQPAAIFTRHRIRFGPKYSRVVMSIVHLT